MHASVSVIIPAYNQARWLPETIESVLAQQVPATEIIVVDDGSPDDSAVIAQSFGSQVRLIRKSNAGLSAARNSGILSSDRDWLIFLDSDDLLPPSFIAMHLENAARTNADVVFAGYYPIDSDGKTIGEAKHGGTLPGESPLEALLRGNAFPPHATMTRRTILAKAGLFDTELTSYEDWDFWLRIAWHGGTFAPTEGLTVPYRQHPTSMSTNAQRMFSNGLRVLEKIESNHTLSRRARRTLVNARWGLRQHFIKSVFENGSSKMISRFWAGIRLDPAILVTPARLKSQSLINAARRRLTS